ncbi:hypothetical protein [Winogradskyella sp. A3E31]|uniref:hypothetical protein n=1 Tax=Winogradskyella sp. A3E31 TaxID=3349637 RepID=UPI00398B6D2F
MGDKKHIDRLFQEKFKDFEMSPRPELWDGISERLHPKKKKRRVVPFWWWTVGGVAAALILFFALGGVSSFDSNPVEDLPVVNVETPKGSSSENSNSKNSEIDSRVTNNPNEKDNGEDLVKEEQHTANEKSTNILKGNGTNTVIANNTDAGAPSNTIKNESSNNPTIGESKVASSSTSNDNQDSEANSKEVLKSKVDQILKSSNSKGDSKVAEKTNEEEVISEEKINSELLKKETSLEEAIAEANDINEEEKEKLNRWSITPNVAPVYFNSLSGGSAIDGQFNDNTNQSDVTMSYGISGAYTINPRLKIKAGVNRVEFNNTTKDVLSLSGSDFAARTAVSGIENISLNSSESDVTLISRASLVSTSVPEALKTTATGNLDQRFGFIEIPISLEYRLIDKKLGVNVSGGFSTFFLNSNEIYADINGNSTLIGTANNLNDTSYSANFGVGFDYRLSKKININLEPMFKYQINTFNNTSGEFRPFFIGVYTGLSFKF